tara:strand:- start:490 stop:1161 length:672 start_codon:yes stop_codon:yes gene_type:complete
MNNMENWNRLSTVPVTSLKPISFGALKGKSDINPQWRYKAMTEVYGSCGIEWSHRLVQSTIVDGANGEKLIYLEVAVKLKDGEEFTGMGGDKIISKDKNGLRSNDEAFKMAYTDALGTALKYLGVASEIYEGNYDGSKYSESNDATLPPLVLINSDQVSELQTLLTETDSDVTKFCNWANISSIDCLAAIHFDLAKAGLNKKKKAFAEIDNGKDTFCKTDLGE